jgi:hypothetical protein
LTLGISSEAGTKTDIWTSAKPVSNSPNENRKMLPIPETPVSQCDRDLPLDALRTKTFEIDDDMIESGWDLKDSNHDQTPIPVEAFALNEAKLLCREAMTLITQEAARLVDHPHLAYAEFHKTTGKTQMTRPNYAYPEVLKERLPIMIGNDALDDSEVSDPAAVLTREFVKENDLYFHIIGDAQNSRTKYISFSSLSLNESPHHRPKPGEENFITGICFHSFRHHSVVWSTFDRESHNAIGAIGFRFAHDEKDAKSSTGHTCHNQFKGHVSDDSDCIVKTLDLSPNKASGNTDINRIEISYVPGSGRIGAITLYDDFAGNTSGRVSFKQWGSTNKEPHGVKTVVQEPPRDGQWRFVGMCGDFVESGFGQVLSRVSGIWRKI